MRLEVGEQEEANDEDSSSDDKDWNPFWSWSSDQLGDQVADGDEDIEGQECDDILEPLFGDYEVSAVWLDAELEHGKD